MNLTIDELIDKAQDQYNRQRYAESLVWKVFQGDLEMRRLIVLIN